jgi:hypothetical protein
MESLWRPSIATYPILQTWSGSGWSEAVTLLAEEAWGVVRNEPEGGSLPSPPCSELGEPDTACSQLAALNEAARTGVRFGALLGFALARTYPGSSEELDGWLERAIEYAGAALAATPAPERAPEDDPSAV